MLSTKDARRGRLILPMNGERFERHRAPVEDIAYSMSAQEIAEKYAVSLEGIQQLPIKNPRAALIGYASPLNLLRAKDCSGI
jgi:hypothetical protein